MMGFKQILVLPNMDDIYCPILDGWDLVDKGDEEYHKGKAHVDVGSGDEPTRPPPPKTQRRSRSGAFVDTATDAELKSPRPSGGELVIGTSYGEQDGACKDNRLSPPPYKANHVQNGAREDEPESPHFFPPEPFPERLGQY